MSVLDFRPEAVGDGELARYSNRSAPSLFGCAYSDSDLASFFFTLRDNPLTTGVRGGEERAKPTESSTCKEGNRAASLPLRHDAVKVDEMDAGAVTTVSEDVSSLIDADPDPTNKETSGPVTVVKCLCRDVVIRDDCKSRGF